MMFCGTCKLKASVICIACVLALTVSVGANAYDIQTAWDNPNNMSSDSYKPGYAKLSWAPGTVLPVKLRNGILTMVNMPMGEQIADVAVGNPDLFALETNQGARTMTMTPKGGNTGGNTNMIVTGQSGNTYVFYLQAVADETDGIVNSQIDVVTDHSISGAGIATPSAIGGSIFKKAASNKPATVDVNGEDYGWIKSMKIDPSEFRFDLDIFVPNPDDYVIAPERVWRDRIFTYIDFGDKVISMTQRPVVSLLVEGGESPVGFRTDGEDGRLLIVEAVGDMVLRSGQRIVCIKKREKPFLISDTASVMALAEANVAQSMLSGQSLNNMAYVLDQNAINAAGVNFTGTPVMIGNTNANVAGAAGYYVPDGFTGVPGSPVQNTNGGTGISMMPTERATAGAYLPQSNVPLITSNQTGVAVELKADTSVKALDDYWATLMGKFSGEDGQGILSKYQNMVFYAVDEQGVGDLGAGSSTARLYRLRIGPMADIDAAQKLCDQLLRFSGASCSVVRMQ